MTKNRAMKIGGFIAAVAAGAAGGLAAGPAGVAIGVLSGVGVGLPMLFHDAPPPKDKPGKKDKRGQIADDEDPQ